MIAGPSLLRMVVVALAALSAAACASYPAEPRYSTRPVGVAPRTAPPSDYVAPVQPQAYEPPPNAAVPREDIQGGGLAPVGPPPGSAYDSPPAQPEPSYVEASRPEPNYSQPPPPASEPMAPVSLVAGATYEVQPGDTLYGIGRRFQSPIQTLVDLNDLGPRAAIRPGMRLVLPDSAVDLGPEERAAGPSPRGVRVPAGTAPPPPPPPPSGNAATPRGMGPEGPSILDWPVRGQILSRFGAVGVSQRNSGVDIGTAEGAEVRASAGGRVYYVGNVVADQGLTVLIVHPDGWRTVYAHLGSERVAEGQDVRPGEVIGTAGRTPGNGPSMHFQVWRMFGDEPRPIDPLTVLPR